MLARMPKTVSCPTCGRPVIWNEGSPYRPFCSKRCRLIDLGAWLAEDYQIADGTDDPTDDPPPSEDSSQTH